MLKLIAAAAENNALGKDNNLLWHLPKDFKRFKTLTSGHFIIMGRKTFESLPGLLPNRTHVVISKQEDYVLENALVAHSLKEGIDLSYEDISPFIIGGGEVYKQAMKLVDVIELTRVHASLEADTFFPEIDEKDWQLVQKEFHAKDEKHKYDFSFLTYHRKR